MQPWETQLINRTASDKGWKLIEGFSQQMRCMPEDVRKGAGILVGVLKECGVEATVYEPEIYLGIPVAASISTACSTISCKASALSPKVENLNAQMIHLKAKPSQQGVHPGDPSSLFEHQFTSVEEARTMVSGRIVLTEGLSNPARTQLLQSWGAVGVVVINPGERSHWGTNSAIWGSPIGDELETLPEIASVAVSRSEGAHLLEMAKAEQAVTLDVDALHGWFSQPVVTAEVRGEGPEADDFVLLHSHYDSWEYGVGDNATGNAVLLEVARLLSQNSKPLRRSVRFAWWPGHSAGRYAGSTWYADAFGPDLDRHCIAHVNCDSPGCVDATSYAAIRSMVEAGPLLKRTVQDLFGQVCNVTRPGRAGDYSFNNLGITGTMLTSSMVPKEERDRRGWYAVGGCGGSPAWHSEYDTLEVADRSILENDIALYGLMVARLANETRIPLDYNETFLELRSSLETFAPKHLDCDQFQQLNLGLAESSNRFAILESLSNSSDEQINLRRLRLSRALVRMNYSIGPAHTQDPARSVQALPVLSSTPELSSKSPQANLARLRAYNSLQFSLGEINRILNM